MITVSWSLNLWLVRIKVHIMFCMYHWFNYVFSMIFFPFHWNWMLILAKEITISVMFLFIGYTTYISNKLYLTLVHVGYNWYSHDIRPHVHPMIDEWMAVKQYSLSIVWIQKLRQWSVLRGRDCGLLIAWNVYILCKGAI